MKNLIVLGSGRSGTSAVVGLFRNEPDIFYGYDILEASGGNPTGYYECEVVNALNNILLRQMTGVSLLDVLPTSLVRLVERHIPWAHRDMRSLWLACPKHRLNWKLSYDIGHLIGRLSRHQPFCLKDPRFGFTLPLWRHYLPSDVKYLVVFRDPAETVESIVRDARDLYGDRPLPITRQWAIEHWRLIYESILDQRKSDPTKWMLVNFDDVRTGEALAALRSFSQAQPDTAHLQPARSQHANTPTLAVGQVCTTLFEDLCSHARKDMRRLG